MTGRALGPKSAAPRLVEVWAPHCWACRAMDADLDDVAARFSNTVVFERVDAASDREAAERLGVRGTPTLIGYVDGVEVYRVTGRQSREKLSSLFTALESNRRPHRGSSSVDVLLRGGAGGALVIAGSAMGPAWPLVIIGMGVLASAAPHVIGRLRDPRP